MVYFTRCRFHDTHGFVHKYTRTLASYINGIVVDMPIGNRVGLRHFYAGAGAVDDIVVDVNVNAPELGHNAFNHAIHQVVGYIH